MEIAREVQARLLPQAPPQLQSADCAARCIQARLVGGDYYDFLDLGDLLAVFSDGITDATCRDEEFGEARLIELLRAHRDASVTGIVAAVLDRVQEFSAGEQSDDLTLLVARVR